MSTALSTLNHTPEAGAISRQDFGGSEVQRLAETAATAIAEREKAMISAMFLMAERHGRTVAKFEQNLLKECERPGFAEVARYKKPQRTFNRETGEWENGFIEGWSVRFAEAAMRHWTNVFCDSKIVYEDDQKRIVRFACIDLESNIPLSSELQLNKTVERKGKKKGNDWLPPEGREVFGERVNTRGDKVFIVAATEDELSMKQAAAWSKFIRNVLRFMPGDILDACEDQLKKTLAGQSPEAALERLTTAFDKLGVTISDMQEYLGHALSKITAKEIDELRGIYTAIKTGETTWQVILEEKQPHGSAKAAQDLGEQKLAEMKAKQTAETQYTEGTPTAERPTLKREPPAVERLERFNSWEAWEQCDSPVHPLIYIHEGPSAGTFRWDEASGSYKVAETAEEPKPRQAPRFGRRA